MTFLCKSRVISDHPGSWFIHLRPVPLLLVLMVCAAVPGPALAMSPGMRGPRQPLEIMTATTPPVPPTAPRQALLTPIRWFQAYVSPTDGPRCQFAPTCSSFGYAAVRDHGPWHGILMTADRLLRCSHLTDRGAYPRRLDGRLADPVASNLLVP
jgi:putative membrane protein insertion efficiency factor